MHSAVCRRVLSGLIFAALLGFVGRSAGAQQVTFPEKPPPESFYVDEVGFLDPAEGAAINEVASSLMREHQIPLMVVTIPSLISHNADIYSIERYAFELFNLWGVGSERRNHGMLLLVSSRDRRARLVLGAAWKHPHNLHAQEIIDTLLLPQFKDGKFSEGILAGVRGMDAMARGLKLPRAKLSWSFLKEKWEGSGWVVAVLGSAVFLRLFRSTSPAQGGPHDRDSYYRASPSNSANSGSSGEGSNWGGISGSW